MNKKQRIEQLEDDIKYLRQELNLLKLTANTKDYRLIYVMPYPSLLDSQERESLSKKNYKYRGMAGNLEVWIKDTEENEQNEKN